MIIYVNAAVVVCDYIISLRTRYVGANLIVSCDVNMRRFL